MALPFPGLFQNRFQLATQQSGHQRWPVAEVQRKIEADLTLNSLGGTIDTGNDEPAPNSGFESDPPHDAKIPVEYKRKIAPTVIA